MARWLLLIALATMSAGCRAPGNYYAPYGSTCIPPPGTGATGAPYYQAPAPAAPYRYPAYPGVPAAQGSTTSTGFPAGAYFADVPVSISPYISNAGAWSSGTTTVTSSAAPNTYAYDNSGARIQPRPSGQLIASGARFRRNDSLPWGSSVSRAPAAVPYATTTAASTVPSIATASHTSPVTTSVVGPGVIYDPAVQIAAPTYYPNEYVLDPYASTYPSYSTGTVGTVAGTQSGWTPR